MKVISCIATKGGVGKTTVAYNLAGILARQGLRVLVCDLDPQGQIAQAFDCAPAKDRRTIADVLTGACSIEAVAIKAAEYDSLWIAPADRRLAGVQQELAARDGGRHALQEALYQAYMHDRHAWQVVVVDTPPTPGVLVQNGIVTSDYVIVPLETTYAAAQMLPAVWESLEGARHYNRWDGKLLFVIPNKYRKNYNEDDQSDTLMREYLKMKKEQIGVKAWLERVESEGGTMQYTLFDRAVIGAAWNNHQVITDYAPKSDAATQMRTLVDAIARRIGVMEVQYAR